MDYDQRVQQLYEAVLRPGMGAIDVGAHVGRHGIEMAKLVMPSGCVMMFEPLPELFLRLQQQILENFANSNSTTVHPYALSDTNGETEFCVAVDAPWFSGMRERAMNVTTKVQHIKVQARRLDDIARDMNSVDFIKIDTEGAEWAVLRGAGDTISRHRPVVTFEFGLESYSAYDVDPVDVFKFFGDKSYVLMDILGRILDVSAFCSSSVKQEVWDYVAVPREKLALCPF